MQTLVLTPVSRSRFFLRPYLTVYFRFANTSHLLSYRLSISLHSQTHIFTIFETRHTIPRSPPRFPHTLASNLYPHRYYPYLRNQSSLAPHLCHRLYSVSLTSFPSSHPSLTPLYSLKPSLHYYRLPFLIPSLHLSPTC